MSAEHPFIVTRPDVESIRYRQLQAKLVEYKQRWENTEKEADPYKSPEYIRGNSTNWYAWYILNAILEKEKTTDTELIEQMRQEADGWFDIQCFASRLNNIICYIEDGGVHLRNGTGLPDVS